MLSLLLALTLKPPETPRPIQPRADRRTLQAEGRVILVTIDGVRWQEATNPELMPSLSDWAVFGDRRLGSRVATSSLKPLSMPGYHALMSGRTEPCTANDCEPISTETLPESLLRRLPLSRTGVAVFASWSSIRHAAAHRAARFTLDTAVADTAPWPDARLDAKTMARALRHLEEHQPRFMWVSLLDSDEHAHQGQHDEYITAIQRYDRFLVTLQAKVAALGLAETTTIILTTDHGRGRGPLWTTHGILPGAREMFLAATGPFVGLSGPVAGGATIHQADVRPTIERLLGLTPTPCEAPGCGSPIPELTPR
jgi:membrane-anchored protein YejM (alkaline phosphatase superfamily)